MLAVAMIGLLSACNGGGGEAGETTTSAAPATSAEVGTTSTTSALSSVTTAPVGPNMNPDEIAIRNLIDIFLHEATLAYQAPDPNRSSLLALTEEPFKSHLIGVLASFRDEGTYFKRSGEGLPPNRVNSVEMAGPDTAIAFQCLFDDRLTYKHGSEQPVDATTGLFASKFTVRRGADGKWRITEDEGQPESEVAAQCGGLV